MFWRFGGYANISTVDTLLDKSDVTLEDLLDESDLIQELKAHNTKLIEFLRDENTLKRLLGYVIAPGPPVENETTDDEEEEEKPVPKSKGKGLLIKTTRESEKNLEEQEKAEKQRLKYAYVACEILSSETWSILEALMSNIPHLTEFWDFLRRPPPLDPLQAGYFTKVNETLLEKKTEDMLEFFKASPGIVPAILQHVDCPMVMDLLLKIISLEKVDGGQGIVDWLQSQDLIPTLLSHLSPDCNSSTQTSAGDFLKAIITISANAAQNEQSCIGPNSLTRQLVSEPCMQSLISSMLQGGNPLTVGVGIVIEVIRKNNSDYDPENGHNPDAPPTSHDPIYLGTLLRMFAKHVPDFMELILSSRHTVTEGETTRVVERSQLNSAWGTQIEPLGFDRFKTCELMAELLHCSNMGLLNERGSEEFIRLRDVERERLVAHGALPSQKEEDSGVDISDDSSRFANGIDSSVEVSPEDLRVANSNEEDGFEKVAASDVPSENEKTEKVQEATTSRDVFAENEKGSLLDLKDDFIVEPLSSPKFNTMAKDGKDEFGSLPLLAQSPESVSPTSANLEEKVRKVSLDDTTMTTPPNEEVSSFGHPVDVGLISQQLKAASAGSDSALSHPEDKPAPLFSKSSDPNRTPTPLSPNPSPTQVVKKDMSEGENSAIPAEGDLSVQMDDNSENSGLQTESDSDEKPVVGDFLKIMFVENKVVPTILNFFFRFPWNNFLHNVVYDVVQQVFNGPMDRGYNRSLAIDLFENGGITDQIVAGQKRSDDAQKKKNMRLGYMGHLTLVAEEVVKFSERHPAELLSQTVMEKVLDRQWIDYVEQTLSETRERDNAILGGVRPDTGLGPRQAVLNAVNSAQGFNNSSALTNAGLNGGGQQGLDSIDLSNNGSASSGAFSSGSSSLLSGFGSSSDDEDEEMDEAEEEDPTRTAQSSTSDTGSTTENSDLSVPLIPPPPAPLNIPPSRARRQLAARLALHNKQQAPQDAAAEDINASADDPFASLGDNDDDDAADPFSLDEEEEDITASGNRNKSSFQKSSTSGSSGFSVSRGITSLFSSHAGRSQQHENADDFNRSLDDDSSSSEGSETGEENGGDKQRHHRPPLEATTSQERIPLEIDDDDDEMGEMVAPSEEEEEEEGEEDGVETNSSDDEDEEVLSPIEKEKLRTPFSGPRSSSNVAPPAALSSSQHTNNTTTTNPQDDDDGDEGEDLVEIAMPLGRRPSRG